MEKGGGGEKSQKFSGCPLCMVPKGEGSKKMVDVISVSLFRTTLSACQEEARGKAEEISELRSRIQDLEDQRNTSGSGPSGIQSSASLDEVKQRVGKLFQRKS